MRALCNAIGRALPEHSNAAHGGRTTPRPTKFLSSDDAVVAVNGNLGGFMENLLQLLPDTRTVAIVNGSSPSEQYWRQEITRE
jgi:hypothetical protein